MKALFLPWRNPIVERGRWKYNLLIALLSWSGEHTRRTFTCIAGGKGCRSRFKLVLQIFINTSDIIRVFKKPVSLARRRKKMDGLEFLAELAPIYRVFPSLPFTLLQHPQTHISSIKTHVTDRHILHPQTHMSSPVGKKTQTQIDIAYAPIKPKIHVTHRHILHTPTQHSHTTHLQNQKHSNFIFVYIPTRCNLAGWKRGHWDPPAGCNEESWV